MQAANRWAGINIYPVDLGFGSDKLKRKLFYKSNELKMAMAREIKEAKTKTGVDVDMIIDTIKRKYAPKILELYDEIYGNTIKDGLMKQYGVESLEELVKKNKNYIQEGNFDESPYKDAEEKYKLEHGLD